MSPFQSLPDYEEFIYGLGQEYPEIQSSTLVLARRGPGLATLTGDLCLQGGYRLAVYEILTWDSGTVSIQSYSYELWKAGQKVYWYDPQPHPNEPSLASTHPHHKHIPPNLKRHRIPAPGLRFEAPNLPLLIREIMEKKRTED